jgi:hypothetical protein
MNHFVLYCIILKGFCTTNSNWNFCCEIFIILSYSLKIFSIIYSFPLQLFSRKLKKHKKKATWYLSGLFKGEGGIYFSFSERHKSGKHKISFDSKQIISLINLFPQKIMT